MPAIGMLNEKPLHASLKEWYARPGDRFEVTLDRFVIDIVRDGLLLEIQTGNLAAIKSKLTKLADAHPIRLIYPIAREKWLVKLAVDSRGEPERRKSPKRGRMEDLFWQMVSFPQLLANPNFSLEVLMTSEEEVRRYDGKRGWRKRGWVTEERRLLAVVEQRLFADPADWRGFLPGNLTNFTARDLARKSGLRIRLAQRMVYCMRKAGLIDRIGKRGRANMYEVRYCPI